MSGLNSLSSVAEFPRPNFAMGGDVGTGGCGGGSYQSLQPIYESYYISSNVPGDPGYWTTVLVGYQWVTFHHSTQVC
jgi:hypothetical protein